MRTLIGQSHSTTDVAGVAGVAPGFSPARAALKGGATIPPKSAVCLVFLLLAARAGWTQGTSKTELAPVPVKVTVVFREYQGGKLVSSLPYILPVNAVQQPRPYADSAHLRVGLRVPIDVGNQIVYQNVGTNIDCNAKIQGNGQYAVHIRAERNSVHDMVRITGRDSNHSSTQGEKPAESRPQGRISGQHPIFDNSSIDETLLMRDGQTIQSLMATDPVTGRVLKVDVTLNVVK